jgi:hypothetical protein
MFYPEPEQKISILIKTERSIDNYLCSELNPECTEFSLVVYYVVIPQVLKFPSLSTKKVGKRRVGRSASIPWKDAERNL